MIPLMLCSSTKGCFFHNFKVILFQNDLEEINIDQNLTSLQNDLNLIESSQEVVIENNFFFYLKLLALLISDDDNLWRLFKGRLYTRLHDKRIQELNLNAIINVSFLFLILIKTISKPVEAVSINF